jgi:hypothetical protein
LPAQPRHRGDTHTAHTRPMPCYTVGSSSRIFFRDSKGSTSAVATGTAGDATPCRGTALHTTRTTAAAAPLTVSERSRQQRVRGARQTHGQGDTRALAPTHTHAHAHAHMHTRPSSLPTAPPHPASRTPATSPCWAQGTRSAEGQRRTQPRHPAQHPHTEAGENGAGRGSKAGAWKWTSRHPPRTTRGWRAANKGDGGGGGRGKNGARVRVHAPPQPEPWAGCTRRVLAQCPWRRGSGGTRWTRGAGAGRRQTPPGHRTRG